MHLFRRNTGPWMQMFNVTGEKKPLTAKFYGTEKEKIDDSRREKS